MGDIVVLVTFGGFLICAYLAGKKRSWTGKLVILLIELTALGMVLQYAGLVLP